MRTSPGSAETEFVTELLRTGITLADLCGNLLDSLPDDAYPNENTADVLIEMIVGSARPATNAAGGDAVVAATALIAATMDRVMEDLRTAADLAAAREGSRPRSR